MRLKNVLNGGLMNNSSCKNDDVGIPGAFFLIFVVSLTFIFGDVNKLDVKAALKGRDGY